MCSRNDRFFAYNADLLALPSTRRILELTDGDWSLTARIGV